MRNDGEFLWHGRIIFLPIWFPSYQRDHAFIKKENRIFYGQSQFRIIIFLWFTLIKAIKLLSKKKSECFISLSISSIYKAKQSGVGFISNDVWNTQKFMEVSSYTLGGTCS
eukprot:258348_1